MKENKTKICSKCSQELFLNSFSNHKINKDGLCYHCKECVSKYRQKWGRKNRIKKKEKIKKRLKEGLCYICGEKRLLSSSRYCEKHWYVAVCGHWLKTSYWKELREIMENQDYKCVYTGDELILGLNVELDHIVPISINPELKNDISNFQWVTKDTNRMKANLIEEQFLSVCVQICKRFDLI